uniref:Uncharacterized protein n=1 Tax=Rhizophora mucronata TaxID=61149 RepID=A0A2P2QPT6_RHIMU
MPRNGFILQGLCFSVGRRACIETLVPYVIYINHRFSFWTMSERLKCSVWLNRDICLVPHTNE